MRTDEAAVRQAQQTLANDQHNLQRDQNLLSQGYISQQSVDAQATLVTQRRASPQHRQRQPLVGALHRRGQRQPLGPRPAASAVQQSQAQEKVAMAQAQQVRVQIGKATIVSPIDGVVVNRNINPGEYPGQPADFTLQQVNPIYAVLHASSEQVARIQNGALATITAPDLGAHARASPAASSAC